MAKRIVRRSQEDLIVDHLTALTNAEIKRFFRKHRVAVGSAKLKHELRAVARKAIDEEVVTVTDVVDFLDDVTPWGKQHVYLYDTPAAPKVWRDESTVRKLLKEHEIEGFLNGKPNELVLPDKMELSSIEWKKGLLRVTTIRRREGWVRDDEYDKKKGKSVEGRPLWLKGFVYQVLRGITAFEWNMIANEAFLQVTQLPQGGSYESVAEEFTKFVSDWLDLSSFTLVDVRKAIPKLQEREEKGEGETVSHALSYSRNGGRRVAIRSSSRNTPLLGQDTVIDGLAKTARKKGVPSVGDFFVGKDGTAHNSDGEPGARKHYIIVGDRKRVNFASPSTEKGIRDVLDELRTLSG